MIRTMFAFAFGFASGLAVAFLIERPIDFSEVRQEARATLGEASRGARDLRVATAVRAALALQKDFSLLGGIGVKADGGGVTLSGTVGTRQHKQLAELIAKGVDGVDKVINNIEILQSEEPLASYRPRTLHGGTGDNQTPPMLSAG